MTVAKKFGPAIAACAIGAALLSAPPAQAFQLITKTEAALPAAHLLHARGISRGPTIIIVSPSPNAGAVQSPIEIRIRFESHGSTTINRDSIVVTYEKDPAIDLTRRLKSYITPDGISVEDADVPPGLHTVRVLVADSAGHESTADFTFRVAE